MEINNVCSLGTLCHTATLLKRNNLKISSYPFDWIFSNINIIIDCIEDDFNSFLDKKYYKNHTNGRCSHLKYIKDMFRHYNPINEEHYNYYIRCVNRFRELLMSEETKLFIIFYPNYNNKEVNSIKDNLVKLDNLLKMKTKNYKILCIFHFSNRKQRYEFFNENNIDYLLLNTKSKCYGLKFINDNDNYYFDSIFNNLYKFNIKNNINNNNDNNLFIT
jgi:hypothetical protein